MTDVPAFVEPPAARATAGRGTRVVASSTVDVAAPVRVRRRLSLDTVALAYVALPTLVFVAGWLRVPFGSAAAAAIVVALWKLLGDRAVTHGQPSRQPDRQPSGQPDGWPTALVILAAGVAVAWTLLAGLGHVVYANRDWVTRDAVLVDLVRDAWPVVYPVDGVALLMRAPIGYFLPAALVGKATDLRIAELALFAWTATGVWLTFALMLRDRPAPKAAAIRIAVFVAFSGMDIVGQIAHYNPHPIGAHLEWWAYLFQYSSQTTQLFWVPNHALPGWLAVAWLLSQDPRRLPVGPAILFVAFAPLWSPLTAVGIAPLVAAALLRRWWSSRSPTFLLKAVFDWRLLAPVVVVVVLVFPYLVTGSDKVASGSNLDVRWVGEDFVPRYIEFVLFEFAGFALLLLSHDRRDLPTWVATGVLLALPFHRFGPYNDLAMRASIPALTLFAIRLGGWLSTPFAATRDPRRRIVAVLLLAIGAVTPFMEIARALIEPRWSIDARSALIDVTRGTHYLTPLDQPWPTRFLRPSIPAAGPTAASSATGALPGPPSLAPPSAPPPSAP